MQPIWKRLKNQIMSRVERQEKLEEVISSLYILKEVF